jgi:cytochrome P450
MRLYPPAPMLMRRTVKPVQLGGVAIGAGATVNIPIYVVHRHRLLWKDPLRFDPSRFAPEAKAKGGDPRHAARAGALRGETPTPFALITLRPKEGLRLKVTLLED